MIFSDRDILTALAHGVIRIEPTLTHEEMRAQVQPASLDVRLAPRIAMFDGTPGVIDTRGGAPAMVHAEFGSDGFVLGPGTFALGSTLERLTLPEDIVAMVNGRSSLGRLGLVVHATAGFIDPGFRGHVTLELFNMGPRALRLYPGMRVAQLVFQRTATECLRAYGHPTRASKYQDQAGPTASRIERDA